MPPRRQSVDQVGYGERHPIDLGRIGFGLESDRAVLAQVEAELGLGG